MTAWWYDTFSACRREKQARQTKGRSYHKQKQPDISARLPTARSYYEIIFISQAATYKLDISIFLLFD